jgi:hypothetical protein
VTGVGFPARRILALSLVTLVAGLRYVFVRTPWQPIYHAVYAAYIGIVVEGMIIDSDHWRHYFLILGVLWGLMATTRSFVGRVRTCRHGGATLIQVNDAGALLGIVVIAHQIATDHEPPSRKTLHALFAHPISANID